MQYLFSRCPHQPAYEPGVRQGPLATKHFHLQPQDFQGILVHILDHHR